MKVNILGTEYEVMYDLLSNNGKYKDYSGYCEYYAKEIHVRKHMKQDGDYDAKDINVFEKKVLRHELIHAFLYESGLSVNSNDINQWAVNEEMVDWMAIQMPKIMKAYDIIVNKAKEKPKWFDKEREIIEKKTSDAALKVILTNDGREYD